MRIDNSLPLEKKRCLTWLLSSIYNTFNLSISYMYWSCSLIHSTRLNTSPFKVKIPKVFFCPYFYRYFSNRNPFQDGYFRDCSRTGSRAQKATPHPKICHTYPRMMKPGMVIPYLKKIQKYIWIPWHTHWVLLTSAFFHRKSANFATSRNTHIDWILIHNF